MLKLDEQFWNERYDLGHIGWDIGHVSTPLKAYFDQLEDKSLRILIPGAGNAYEAEYLHKIGFMHVTVLDLSASALNRFQSRVPEFPVKNLLHGDFFDHQACYDLVIEQTFFCAIAPSLRKQYVTHMHQLLMPGGKLVGLLFNIPLNSDRPPFGGHKSEYLSLFEPYFDLRHFELAYNSIPPRQGNELFIHCVKK